MQKAQHTLFAINQALAKINTLRASRSDVMRSEVLGGNGSQSEPALVAVEKSRKSVLPLVILFCAISMAASGIHAQEALPRSGEITQTRAKEVTTTNSAVQGKSCEVWDDESSSVSQEDRAEALRRMESLLGQFTKEVGCRRIRVGHFTNEARFAKFAEFELPQAPSFSCTPTPSKYASIFTLFKAVEEQKAEQECSTRRQEANRKFEQERAEVLGNAQKILLNKDKKPQLQERCTDITGLLRARVNMASEPTLIMLLTDGISDCQSEIREIQIPRAVRVILLLLPPDPKRISANRVEEWMKMWATAAPEVMMVPWVNLTPSWIHHLAQVQAVRIGAVQNSNR